MANVLETPHLQLRACTPADLADLGGLWRDPAVRRFLFDDRIISADEVRAFVYASIESFASRGYGIFVVRERYAEVIAGFAGLLDAAAPIPRLLYGVRPDLWGRGYATEAAAAVLEYALGALGLARVLADVDEPNAASIRVLEKLGMSKTGRQLVGGKPLICFEALAASRR
jgi:RimJ/RimL family protein N-acetyltransferase